MDARPKSHQRRTQGPLLIPHAKGISFRKSQKSADRGAELTQERRSI
jgi:hypothetical protein